MTAMRSNGPTTTTDKMAQMSATNAKILTVESRIMDISLYRDLPHKRKKGLRG